MTSQDEKDKKYAKILSPGFISWMKFSLAKENFPEIPIFCGVFSSRLSRRSLSFFSFLHGLNLIPLYNKI